MAVDVLAADAERSAAPAAVTNALQQLRERDHDLDDRLRADEGMRHALVAVVAASRSLTRLLLASPDALDVLADLDRAVPADADIAAWKQRELLRIAARDLVGLDPLEVVGRSL